MGRCVNWNRVVLLACFCAPAVVHAQAPQEVGRVVRIAVPHASPSTRVEWSLAPGAAFADPEWDVTVALDFEHCELHCAYRRRRDASGRVPAADQFLPPVTIVRIYRNGASPPENITVNPAGVGQPLLTAVPQSSDDLLWLISKRFDAAPAAENAGGASCSVTSQTAATSAAAGQPFPLHSLPLRL